MVTATEFQQVTSGVWIWQAYDPRVKADLTCCARRIGSGLVLIDPIALAKNAWAELLTEAEATPAAIVLTNGNHDRAAEHFRNQLEVPIFATAAAGLELEVAIDLKIGEHDSILGELEVVTLPGGGPGEVALHADGVLHVGDALINFGSAGFSILPDKYCEDAKALRQSLGKLLRFDFRLLTFAHGLPLATKARPRFAELIS